MRKEAEDSKEGKKGWLTVLYSVHPFVRFSVSFGQLRRMCRDRPSSASTTEDVTRPLWLTVWLGASHLEEGEATPAFSRGVLSSLFVSDEAYLGAMAEAVLRTAIAGAGRGLSR